jgi:glycosyltransferase involved in cell wall biosynthesis
MKKVCIFSSAHFVFDLRIFGKIAKTLKEAGYQVIIIGQHNKNEMVDGIQIIALSEPKNRFFRIFGTTWKTFSLALKERADIYHFYDPELIPISLLLKALTGAKVVYDVRENHPQQILIKYWLPEILRELVAATFNLIEKTSVKFFNYVIAVTPVIRDKFKQPNVIDIRNYPIIKMFSSKPKKKKKNEYHLIYAGDIAPKKGVKEIIQALDFIKSKYKVKLKIFGKFSEPEYGHEVKKMSRGKNVEFLGHIPYQILYQQMERSNIGLVCSIPEMADKTSLPVKLFEYMAAGLPVVASNFLVWRKIVEGNQCGICVNSDKPKEIAEAIEYLIKNPQEAEEMGYRGKQAVFKKYNWEKESQKLLKVYEKLLKS